MPVKSGRWLFPLLPILLMCACSRSVLLDAPGEPEMTVEAAAIAAEQSAENDETKPADIEELLRILDGAADMQPGCAGSSLRLAALAGSLVRWMEDNPLGGETAADGLRSWAEKQDVRKLLRIRSTLHLLEEGAERLRSDRIAGLLADAGVSLPDAGPTREEFIALAERLTAILESVIFKNLSGK